jgi:Protein of unknown function (DUF3037)
MVSRYSVIQYVPNPIANERINVGVLAFDDEIVRVHFLSRWDRVRCFGATESIDFLRDFAHRMEEAVADGLLFPGDEAGATPKHERLTKVAKGWINSIQFTEPHGSLEDVDSLLEDTTKTYLLEITPEKRKLRDRQAAARAATSHVRKIVKQHFGDEKAKELIRIDYELKGGRKEHKFDVTVANGRPFLAAHGISFEIQTPESLVDSLAFMILDVKASNQEFPIGIVVLPPKQASQDYKRLNNVYQKTTRTYQELGAKVLQENEVESWVSERLVNVNV